MLDRDAQREIRSRDNGTAASCPFLAITTDPVVRRLID